ncbi:hypothetical protein ACW5BZ_07840 [Pediococcus pentosaceus]
MSVVVPIYKVRLGHSEVETPDLVLGVTNVMRGDNTVRGILKGDDDLVLSVLQARNGEALVGDQWIKFQIHDLGDQVEVKCDPSFNIADAFLKIQ